MIDLVIDQRRKDLGGFEVGRVLPYAKRRMVGPFVFFDHMGPVDFQAGFPRTVDVRPHPHIGHATVTGAADYELRIVTRDMHAFDDFLREKILGLGLVSNIESRIVIRSVKNTTAAPLGLVSPYVSAQG